MITYTHSILKIFKNDYEITVNKIKHFEDKFKL